MAPETGKKKNAAMDRHGPELEHLTRRMAETPAEFLDEPRIGAAGRVHVAALVNDVLALHGQRASHFVLQRFVGNTKADRNRLALAMLAAWLLADDWFVCAGIAHTRLVNLFDELTELAAVTAAHQFANDPDRREELARVVLARLGLRPAGESPEQAADRLSRISGTERARLLAASRAAEERARAVREALARKAAEESADKWSRE
jgi:hypothetical protein